MTTRGFLYVALGKQYLKDAIISANSLKYFNPGATTAIFTDLPEKARSSGKFDVVQFTSHTGQSRNQYMLDRLTAWQSSPFDTTVALDADTYIMDEITDVFSVLDRFDIVIAHGHKRERRHRLAVQDGAISRIPYAFPPLQGGLVGWSNSPNSTHFMRELQRLYIEKNYYDDQVSMRELLWSGQYGFSILPSEYNFNSIDFYNWWKKHDFTYARPKIFHYTAHKNVDIENFVREHCDPCFVAPKVD